MIANIYRYTMDNLSLRGFLEFSFLKDFKFRVNANYGALNLNQTEFMTPIGGDALSVNGQGSKATQRVDCTQYQPIADLRRRIWRTRFERFGGTRI